MNINEMITLPKPEIWLVIKQQATGYFLWTPIED